MIIVDKYNTIQPTTSIVLLMVCDNKPQIVVFERNSFTSH